MEDALWAAIRVLQEKADLSRQMATRSKAIGNEGLVREFEERAEHNDSHAARLIELVQANGGDDLREILRIPDD